MCSYIPHAFHSDYNFNGLLDCELGNLQTFDAPPFYVAIPQYH